jgi:hypothetical protein
MNDEFDMPDMDGLTRQMEEALNDAKEAMADLPAEMGEMGSLVGALAGLTGGLPEQMAELSGALGGFEEQHQANVQAMAGEADWSLVARIEVGEKLEVVVKAGFDLEQVIAARESTQGAEFESVVAGVLGESAGEMDEGMMNQVIGQLKKGRSMAVVNGVEVVACRIAGAPRNAVETLQLSPEGHIPLVMDKDGLGFEFAPLLTIRNRWERAQIPTFVPMGEEVVVPLDHFERREAFRMEFEPQEQEEEMRVALSFEPLG